MYNNKVLSNKNDLKKLEWFHLANSIKGLGFVLLVIIISTSFDHLQGQTNETDSLIKRLEFVTNDTARIDLLLRLSLIYQKDDIEQSGRYAREAYDKSQLLGDEIRIAHSQIAIGSYHTISGQQIEMADSLYQAALDIGELYEDERIIRIVYNNMGNRLHQQGDMDGAVAMYIKALELDPDTTDREAYATTLRNIGIVFDESDRRDQAEPYIQSSIAIAETDKNDFLKAESLNSLAIVYCKNGDLSTCIYHFKETIALYRKEGKLEAMLNAVNNISLAYRLDGQQDSALYFARGLLDQSQQTENLRLQMRCHIILAGLLNDQGVDEEALHHYERTHDLAKEIGDSRYRYRALQSLGSYYEQRGDYKTAIEYFKRHEMLEDTMVNEQTLAQLNDLEQLYEKARRETQLTIQENEIKEQRRHRNYLLGGTAFLILLGLSLLSNMKRIAAINRKAAESELALQAEKIRILEKENKIMSLDAMINGQEEERRRVAKDLHDGLGSLMATVKGHFQAIQNEVQKLNELNVYQKTNKLIDQACDEVRRISHNMMPQALTENGLKDAALDLVADFSDRTQIVVDADIQGELKDLDETISVMLYRVLQELFTNIEKHAKASHVLIQIIKKEDHIHVLVEDDGTGFEVRSYSNEKGLGLQSIHSRIAYLNGKVDFDSVIGEGTTVMMDVPTTSKNQQK